MKLLSEASIGSGVRRVEALVGLDAFRFLAREHVLVSQLAEQFKAKPEELPERIGGVVERLRQAERELEKVRADAVLSSAGALADGAEDVGGTALVAAAVPGGVGARRPAGAGLRRARPARRPAGRRRAVRGRRRGEGVVRRRHHRRGPRRGAGGGQARAGVRAAVGGRGGGKPDLAQGGGTDPSGVPAAIDALRRELATAGDARAAPPTASLVLATASPRSRRRRVSVSRARVRVLRTASAECGDGESAIRARRVGVSSCREPAFRDGEPRGGGGAPVSARGRRLGVDVGAVRVGVALSDPDGVLATPLVTVPRDVEHGTDVAALRALVAEHEAVEVVVGLPRTLAGREGPAAEAARAFGDALAAALPVPVVYADERLTTVVATQQLRSRGVKGRKQRAVIDQAAAVAILQGWLDARR